MTETIGQPKEPASARLELIAVMAQLGAGVLVNFQRLDEECLVSAASRLIAAADRHVEQNTKPVDIETSGGFYTHFMYVSPIVKAED